VRTLYTLRRYSVLFQVYELVLMKAMLNVINGRSCSYVDSFVDMMKSMLWNGCSVK
jgi:hypothetical protein